MMRKGDMVVQGRKSLHSGAFGRERECLNEKHLYRICISDAVEFVCHGRGAVRNEKTRIFGHSFLDVPVVPYLDLQGK